MKIITDYSSIQSIQKIIEHIFNPEDFISHCEIYVYDAMALFLVQTAPANRSPDGPGAEAGGRVPVRELPAHHQQRGDRVLPGKQEGTVHHTGHIQETGE